MHRQKTLTVSVVIPCYNEEELIDQCLNALSQQTVKPLEIIVVDNNCSDQTIAIAKKYKAVKVVAELRQGLANARTRGMNAARGQIIARLDADSRPAPEWVAVIQKLFSDESVEAATGTGDFYDFPAKRFSKTFRNIFAVHINRLALGHHMLWGSNMALRQSCWKLISRSVCEKPNIMEDLDIAMHIAENYGGTSLVYSASMQVDISARRGATGLVKNFLYLKMWPTTLKNHYYWRSFIVWPAVFFLAVAAGPIANTATRLYGPGGKRLLNRRQGHHKTRFNRGNP